jgi:hypothetical protein
MEPDQCSAMAGDRKHVDVDDVSPCGGDGRLVGAGGEDARGEARPRAEGVESKGACGGEGLADEGAKGGGEVGEEEAVLRREKEEDPSPDLRGVRGRGGGDVER